MEESLTTAATLPAPHTDDLSAKRSRGEKLFDWVTYGGAAGVGTFFTTLAMAYWLKYGAPAKKVEVVAEKLEKGLGHVLSPAHSKTVAQNMTMTGILMQGGNAMLLPIAWAEKHKEYLVAKANAMLGDTTPQTEMVKSPPQTLLSLVQGRLTAFAVVWASLQTASSLFKKSFAMFGQEFAELTCKLFRKPTQVVGPEGALVASKTYRYGEMAAVDTFATVAAASLLYVGGHFFARRHEEKKAHLPPELRNRGGILRDDAGEAAPEAVQTKAGPSSAIMGEKTHHGIAQQPVHAPTISS